MAGIALIVEYQWRAFWRRITRTRQRIQFYLTALATLGWMSVAVLPARLSRAAEELAAGQTASMDTVLWAFSALWLFVVVEDVSVSLTSRQLRLFPIDVGRLLGVRILSVFCSPLAVVVAVGSLISLWPFLFARRPLLGSVAAVLLFALALALAMSMSHILGVADRRTQVVAPAAVIGVIGVAPPHLVSLVAVAPTASATVAPLVTLVALGAAVCSVLVWSFRRSLFAQQGTRAVGRAVDSTLWFPGRLGALVRKEQHDFRTLLDLWLGLLLVSAVSVGSLFGAVPAIIRQAVMAIAFLCNINAAMNCFGMNTGAELSRYAILPLSGREVLLVKNLGLAVVVAAQLALLILSAAWQLGPMEAGVEVVEAVVLLLSHLAWGNLASIAAPFKMEAYRFAANGTPLATLFGASIGSIPAVLMLFFVNSESSSSATAIVGIVLLAVAAYVVSLRYAGRRFERRWHIIAQRLS